MDPTLHNTRIEKLIYGACVCSIAEQTQGNVYPVLWTHQTLDRCKWPELAFWIVLVRLRERGFFTVFEVFPYVKGGHWLFRIRAKKLTALAFIPVADVILTFESVATQFLQDERPLLSYFEKTWTGAPVAGNWHLAPGLPMLCKLIVYLDIHILLL